MEWLLGDNRMKSKGIDVAVGGFGAIGRRVAVALDQGIPPLRLVAVSARDKTRAEQIMSKTLARPVPVLPLETLGEVADVVVECVPSAELARLATPVLQRGKTLIVMSVGALLDEWHLVKLATQEGGRILVPSGALLGLDAVQAAAQGNISSVRMITRKPVNGLEGAPYLEKHGISLDGLREAKLLFSGMAADAIREFPANLNVAIALGLAGIGPERTELQVWADPAVTRNTHSIEVVADSASFKMQIENIPSEENAKTGKITALSVISTLRRLTSPVVIGA
jgi:aspartate dehydrogenase